MIYLREFILPTWAQEELDNDTPNEYPYGIFPFKKLDFIEFGQITIFYGNNGSGKSTLLNLIAEKLHLNRTTAFNGGRLFSDYVNRHCDYEQGRDEDGYILDIPRGSETITSEDIFSHIVDVREDNIQIRKSKDMAYDSYCNTRSENLKFNSLEDYDQLKLFNEARSKTPSRFIRDRTKQVINQFSNGETALKYYDEKFQQNKLYLLDEPENSLSPMFQLELRKLILDCAYYCNCQFIIATHSPFLLSLNGARIYDLDSVPTRVKRWEELENIKVYHEFFNQHGDLFQKN